MARTVGVIQFFAAVCILATSPAEGAASPTVDLVLQARCQAKCGPKKEYSHQQCVEACWSSRWDKAGDCPLEVPLLTLGCLEECLHDGQCPKVDKCCSHTCGVTCQPPRNLHNASGLSEVPYNVTVTERRKSRSVSVEWAGGGGSGSSGGGDPVLFVVEWRHLSGAQFREARATPWTGHRRSPLANKSLKMSLKPATWYQFRVAAVNANGSRGFSQPSKPFKLSVSPVQPGSPEDLITGPVSMRNKTVSVVLRWKPPASDVPVNRYLVYWSRRISSDQVPPEQGSVMMQQKSVSHERTSIRIKNLLPESLYFFQVQAQAQYGKKRLLSTPSSIVFNTSIPFDKGSQSTGDKVNKCKKLPMHKSKFTILDGKLSTKISWKSQPYYKYAITWESSCGSMASKSLVIVGSNFELMGLKFGCKYNILLREKSGGRKGRRSGKISFVTPLCSDFTPSACSKNIP